jgi:hypothetical protein
VQQIDVAIRLAAEQRRGRAAFPRGRIAVGDRGPAFEVELMRADDHRRKDLRHRRDRTDLVGMPGERFSTGSVEHDDAGRLETWTLGARDAERQHDDGHVHDDRARVCQNRGSMVRLTILLLLMVACKKKEEPAPDPMPIGEAPRGHSVTTIKGSGDEPDDGGSGSGGAATGTGRFEKLGSAGASNDDHVKSTNAKLDAGVDAASTAGDGSPPYIDDEGHLHGPGGPVFMGRGAECNAERDHCMRAGVWFAAGNVVAGKLYRAVPVYEYEKKWYNWRGKEESFEMRFRTKVGTRELLKAGDPVIFFIDENASKKFVDNEFDALTSSRWEVGVIESVGTDKIRVKGWTFGAVPIDTTRVIIERK